MNQDNSNQTNQSQSYADVKAEVIGELRKDKIGKPLTALLLLVLFIGVLIATPAINKLMTNEESPLYKYFNTTKQGEKPIVENPNKIADASEPQLLDANTEMMFNNLIVMKAFTINEDSIDCTIYSYTGVVNLDEEEYYLEISSQNDASVGYYKLTGTIDVASSPLKLKSNIRYNLAANSYYGKVVLMKSGDYPKVKLSSDESGIAELSCKGKKETLVYTFKNNYLIGVEHTVKVSYENNPDYQNELKAYRKKADAIGHDTKVEENTTGFKFHTTIDYETMRLPSSAADYKYFEADKEAKIVKYNIEGKGFECQ